MLTPDDFRLHIFSASTVSINECGLWLYAGTGGGSWTMPVRAPSYAAGQTRRADASVYWVACLPSAAPLTLNRASTDNFLTATGVSTTFVLMPGESAMIIDDGATWLVLTGATPPAVYQKTLATSAGTRTLSRGYSTYIYTGAGAAVWDLPALANNTGMDFKGKNRGAGNVTLQRAGTDQLYTTEAVTSIVMAPGESFHVVNDGTYWVVM